MIESPTASAYEKSSGRLHKCGHGIPVSPDDRTAQIKEGRIEDKEERKPGSGVYVELHG